MRQQIENQTTLENIEEAIETLNVCVLTQIQIEDLHRTEMLAGVGTSKQDKRTNRKEEKLCSIEGIGW